MSEDAKKTAYMIQQDKRRNRRRDRTGDNDDNFADRLADGFDILEEDDQEDLLPFLMTYQRPPKD